MNQPSTNQIYAYIYNMYKWLLILLVEFGPVPDIAAQIHLSPVNCGDCVADRLFSKRTAYVDRLKEKYCNDNNPDKAKAKKCIENGKLDDMFEFFTDRCSESEYYLGMNGKEVLLRRTSKKRGRPHYFIGAYAGEGVIVNIGNPRLIGKVYEPEWSRKESDMVSATYKVEVMIRKGKQSQTFKDMILSSGW